MPEIVQYAGLSDANVYTFQVAYVTNVLWPAYADHRKNAKIVLVVKHGGQIVSHLQSGIVGVGASGYDGDRVFVDLLASIDSDTDNIVADSLDIGGLIINRLCRRIEPLEV